MIAAAAALAGIFVALYLTLYKLGVYGDIACGFGSCETVQASRWSELFGLPVAAWGVAFYVITFSVAVAGTSPRWTHSPLIPRALLALGAGGFLFSAWLTYLELFVIRAICQWCVVSAVLATVVFVASAVDWRSESSKRA